MTTALTTTNHQSVSPWTGLPIPAIDPKAVEEALMVGDLAKMQPHVRVAYYLAVCQSSGLNPLTRPFTALKGQDGRIFLYGNKECAEQLRKVHRVSLSILSRERVDDLYIVTVRAWTPDGRQDEAQGIIEIDRGMRGTALSNAFMKAETKAKRRVTFSLCGLGFPGMEDAPRDQEVALDLGTGLLPGDAPAPPAIDATEAELFDRSDGDPRKSEVIEDTCIPVEEQSEDEGQGQDEGL